MKKRSEAEWRELACSYYASGIGQKAWCEANGINIYTLRDRLSKLRKTERDQGGNTKETAPNSVWVTVKEAYEAPETHEPIIIGTGSFEIRLMRNFDEVTLLQVCRVLAKLC